MSMILGRYKDHKPINELVKCLDVYKYAKIHRKKSEQE